jgi:hypothetical protein
MQFKKFANAVDESTSTAFEVFQFTKLNGDVCLLQLARDKAGNCDTVYRELVNANAALPAIRRYAHYEIETAIGRDAPAQWIYAKAAGWRNDEAAFLIGDDTIRRQPGLRIYPPGGLTATLRISLLRRGALSRWQQTVAAPALAFPPFVASLAAAFAAPLVAPCHCPSFRLHLFGGTELRRMAAVALAGSTAGLGPAHIAQLSRLAAAQLPAVARLVKDLPLPLHAPDMAMEGAARCQAGVIADKLLSACRNLETGLALDAAVDWRGVVISAEQLASQAPRPVGASCLPGAEACTLDLPVSLFVWAKAGVTEGGGMVARRLLRACDRRSGVAFRRYLKFLVARHCDLGAMARRFETAFHDEVKTMDRRLARSPLLAGFARLYAGGAMAIAAGVVPWSPAELTAALIACLKVAHQHARRHTMSVTSLRRQLRQRLRAADLIRPNSGPPFGPEARVGFCRGEQGRQSYTIHAKAFRAWFASRAERIAVLRWLHEAGHLSMGERTIRPSATSTEWAERTVRWPDGRVHRSYVFQAPFEAKHKVVQTRLGAG